MKKFLILILVASSFCLTNCKDEEPHYLGEFKLGPEGEAYIKFEPGSYWVYQNSKTSRVDTIVMQSYHSEMRFFEGKRNTFYDEHLSIRWKGNSGDYVIESLHPFPDATPHESLLSSLKYHSLPVTHLTKGTTLMFFFPMDKPETAAVSGQTTLFNGVQDSLQVNGSWYYDVAEFEVDNDPQYRTDDANHTKYYWAKNIGLIRRVLLEENTDTEIESYDLITYQIN